MSYQFQYSDKNPSMSVAYSSFNAMHTRMEIVMAGTDCRETAEGIVSALWDKVRKDDEKLNRFSDTSDIYSINCKAAMEEIPVDDELFMILKMCQVFKSSTLGYFDITANVSSREDAQSRGDYVLDEKKHTVAFSRDSIKIDLGGFAKGYTLEKAVKTIRETGIRYALINAGDSSSYALGNHPFGEYWPMGIEHPYFPGKTLYEFHLKDKALSISGKNRQGKPHIIDPKNGNLIECEEMIAASGPSALVAEILSTALYVSPKELRKEIKDNFPGYEAMEIRPLCNGDRIVTDI